MPRVLRIDKTKLLADWKTGKYSMRDLASMYKVSTSTIHKLVGDTPKASLENLADETVKIKQQVAGLNEHERFRYEQLVDERLQAAQFFQKANLLVAKTVATKVQRDGVNAQYGELSMAASALQKAQESVLGKQPETVINNTNQLQQATVLPPPDEYARILREVLRDL